MGRPKGSKNGVRRLIDKICPICGKAFQIEPYAEREINCCSLACRSKQHSKDLFKQQSRTCQICATSFMARPSSKKIYCSRVCASKAHAEKVRLKWNSGYGKRQRLPREAQCRICDTAFRPRQVGHTMCSPDCANKSFMRRIELTCPICGKVYSTRAKKRNQKTCSRSCRTVWIGKTESYLERSMEQALIASNLLFEKQFPFGPFTADFAMPEYQLAIECDGSYWHSLPEVRKRDAKRNNYFRRSGWKILRFGEEMIKTDIKSCIAKVRSTLAASLEKVSSSAN